MRGILVPTASSPTRRAPTRGYKLGASSPAPDLTGEVFGRLTVVARTKVDRWGNQHWRCSCACGGVSYPKTNALLLRPYGVRSCGCAGPEARAVDRLINIYSV